MNIKILALFVEMVNIAYCSKGSDRKVWVEYNSRTNSIDVTYFNDGTNSTDCIYLDWEHSDIERTVARCKKVKERIIEFFKEEI